MQLLKHDPVSYFEIWHPRYSDKKVLLAAHKVGIHNKIVFTKSRSMGTDPYYLSGPTIKKYRKESNGKITVYAVDIAELEPLTISERDLRAII